MDDKEIDLIKEEASKINFKPFSISIKGLSYFGDFPNVIFAGVVDASGTIAGINRILQNIIPKLKKSEEQEQIFHVTVARTKKGYDSQKLLQYIADNKEHFFGEFIVNSFCIKKSILTSRGPIHQDIIKFELLP